MLQILKEFYWAMKDPIGRMHFRYWFVVSTPGPYGFLLRARVLRNHFKRVGEKVRIHTAPDSATSRRSSAVNPSPSAWTTSSRRRAA